MQRMHFMYGTAVHVPVQVRYPNIEIFICSQTPYVNIKSDC